MDNRDNNVSDGNARDEEIKKFMEVTEKEVTTKVVSCSMHVFYRLFITYMLDYSNTYIVLCYIPFFLYNIACIVGEVVIAMNAEEFIKQDKQLEYYTKMMNDYRDGKEV